eukprot:UN07654
MNCIYSTTSYFLITILSAYPQHVSIAYHSIKHTSTHNGI